MSVVSTRDVNAPLVQPGYRAGLLDVFRRRYLLRLLVRKGIQQRYSGSFLGLLWSYVQPAVQFSVYFFVMGLILGMHKNVPNFPIHLFSGMVIVHYFTETFSQGTRSIVQNRQIVQKMSLPREMFPVSAMMVAAIHTFPQLLILWAGALVTGWSPDPVGLLAGFLGIMIVAVFGTGLALIFSAGNVFFRDFQNIVSTFALFIRWTVPMIYPFSRLATSHLAGTWVYKVYLMNPISIAVLNVQRCFWSSTVKDVPNFNPDGFPSFPTHLIARGILMLAVALVFLGICQLVFSRFEGKLAERL
ncbi:MAG TPA: ABC transporter permease [Nocardioidaceae bacterium]|nr:ABC transporter permease [Nocardioidaceae bacterium]